MENNILSIPELSIILKTNEVPENILNSINDLFSNYILNKKICSEEELNELEKFINKLKNYPVCGKQQKYNIYDKIKKIFILSKDESRFETFEILDKKNISELTEKETLEYMDILISNCPGSTFRKTLYIDHYLENCDSINNLITLLNNYSHLMSKNELKDLKYYIYNTHLKNILNIINTELQKRQISSENLLCFFELISKSNYETISEKNILSFRNILKGLSNSNILNKVDNASNIPLLKEKINNIFNELINNSNNETKIKNNFISGTLKLSNAFPNKSLTNLNLKFDDLPIAESDSIITIDDPLSPDLDGAFSIKDIGGTYILDVYVSDVPVFLRNNRKICEEAYLKGTSMYVRNYNANNNINIDMIPAFLSHNWLSLHLGYPKNVINFSFIISEDGEIYSQSVTRKKIKVTDKLNPQEAQNILNSDEYLGPLQTDLRNYKKICAAVAKKSNDKHLKNTSSDKINDLVGFPSVLVNYYIGHEAEFAIYRDKGIYTTNSSNHYTHSVTPIRRFVSNINLAFFLEQKGVVSFPNKDLHFVQNNIGEIISHLNEREEISKFVDKNSRFVKKYLKK